MKSSNFPPGWDEQRVRKVIDHYERQSEDEAVAEDEAAYEDASCTLKKVPKEEERLLLARVGSIRRRRCVSFQEAKRCLRRVEHKMFQAALDSHWQEDQDGNVTQQSICWLFCWAATGINSSATAETCKLRFNKILDKDYNWFKSNIGHEFARKFRYRKTRKIEL